MADLILSDPNKIIVNDDSPVVNSINGESGELSVKTINNESILGEGDIEISGGTTVEANPSETTDTLSSITIGDTSYSIAGGGVEGAWTAYSGYVMEYNDGTTSFFVYNTDGVDDQFMRKVDAPAENGTYTLKATVLDGIANYSWVLDT